MIGKKNKRLLLSLKNGLVIGSLRRKKGWYLATGGLRLDDGSEIAIADLTQGNVVAGGRFVRLPNGDFVAIEERIRKVMNALGSAEPISPKSGELRGQHRLKLGDAEPQVGIVRQIRHLQGALGCDGVR